ncbi:MAG: YajG family lipoprotein [Bacteroidota bacterium]
MNSVTKPTRANPRTGWALALASLLALFAGGCAGPQNVMVNLGPYAPQRAEGAPAARGTVRIEPVKDARANAVGSLIGQRTAFAGVPMGDVEISPLPTDVMGQLLRTEFAQMGYGVGSSAQFTVGAQLRQFQVVTPATALYWDVNGSVELAVTVTAQDGRKHDASYTAACTDRTYVYPSEDLIGKVLTGCVRDIGAKLRGDAALARFLAGK